MPDVSIAELTLDYTLYPRHETDDTNVRRLVEAIQSVGQMTPIVVDRATKRVVDGFHRVKAVGRIDGPMGMIEVEWADYDDDAALFVDAMRRNAQHGRALSPYDQARCIVTSKSLSIDPDVVATCLNITASRLENIKDTKVARVNSAEVVIKNTLRDRAGSRLTKRQVEGNRRAGGMSPMYYINQTINLLENDVMVLDERYAEALRRLCDLVHAKM